MKFSGNFIPVAEKSPSDHLRPVTEDDVKYLNSLFFFKYKVMLQFLFEGKRWIFWTKKYRKAKRL